MGFFWPLKKREREWAESTFTKTSGTVPGDREKNWPIADRRVLSNHPGSSFCGKGRFLFDRTGRPDHCSTSQFDNEIGFFQEFLLKDHLLRAYYSGFDSSGRRVLIKREIITTTGKVWPVSSDKWKAPLVVSAENFSSSGVFVHGRRKGNTLY